MSRKAIVLLSGGLDSTVCLWWALKQGFSCHALSFDYGQRHTVELDCARRIAKCAGVPWMCGKFSLPWSGSSLTDRKRPLPHRSAHAIARASSIPSTYVPARNTLFLSFALSWADQLNAPNLVIGANAIDYSGYPDCRPNYLRAFERVANLGSRLGTEGNKKIRILAPLLRLTKAQILKLGMTLDAPIHLSWSCYRGGKRPCGACDSCLLREKGFQESGLVPRSMTKESKGE